MVFVEAPFPSTAGPDVLSVYAECGPFKRWVVTVEPNAVEKKPVETWRAIDEAIRVAMRRDDELGATGDWVAVLGFSQGAKIAGSLLLRQQERRDTMESKLTVGGDGKAKIDFKVGVLMAGRGPFIPLLFDTDQSDSAHNDDGAYPEEERQREKERQKKTWLTPGESFNLDANIAARRVITDTPTIHVHGMQDPGIDYHKVLLEDWCQPGTTTLLEWEGNHRLPLKTADVVPVVETMVTALKRQGVVLPGGGGGLNGGR